MSDDAFAHGRPGVVTPVRDRMPIRVGQIGCGNIAVRAHLPAYLALSDDFQVAAVADPSSSGRDLARQLVGLGAESVYADPLDVIARPDIDMIDLCTPQHVRTPLAIAALERGKHVLAEKPLAVAPRDAAAMVDAARASGVRLGVVHNYLLLPEVIRALEMVGANEIGPVEVAILNWLGITDHPGVASYRPTWRHDPAEAGGGVLMDMLHIVYLAEALLGRPIERVSAYINARADASSVEDVALCRFETGVSAALVNIGWGAGPGGFALSGPDGRIEVTYEGGGSGVFSPFDRLTSVGRSGRRVVTNLSGVDPIRGVIADFAGAIRDRRDPLASGEQGLHILEATVAAYASAATGRTIPLPLEHGSPVYELGVGGLSALEGPTWTPIRRRRIFGVS